MDDIKDLMEKKGELYEKIDYLKHILHWVKQARLCSKFLSSEFATFSFNDANIERCEKEYEKLKKRISVVDRLITIKKNAKEIAWLDTDFCKYWLNEMRFTTRKDGDSKYLFLSIMPGCGKMSDDEFDRMCKALCLREFGENLCARMYLCGKVDWTMFYKRPDHVNGTETYFCGVVWKDDFSPEDWDKNHDEYWFDEKGFTKNRSIRH